MTIIGPSIAATRPVSAKNGDLFGKVKMWAGILHPHQPGRAREANHGQITKQKL
jgi:hypothetical protein